MKNSKVISIAFIAIVICVGNLCLAAPQTRKSEQLLAKAQTVLSQENDIDSAAAIYRELTALPTISAEKSAEAWLGLARCYRTLGKDNKAQEAFQRSAAGEGPAAKLASAILRGEPDQDDERLTARIRDAIHKVREMTQDWEDAQNSLVFIGKPAVGPLAFEIKNRTDASDDLGRLVVTIARIGGKIAAKFFDNVRGSGDQYLRRAVIGGLTKNYRESGRALSRKPVRDAVSRFMLDEDTFVQRLAIDLLFREMGAHMSNDVRNREDLGGPNAKVAVELLNGPNDEAKIYFLNSVKERGFGWVNSHIMPSLNDHEAFASALKSCIESQNTELSHLAFRTLVSSAFPLADSGRLLLLDCLEQYGPTSKDGIILGASFAEQFAGAHACLGDPDQVSAAELLRIAKAWGQSKTAATSQRAQSSLELHLSSWVQGFLGSSKSPSEIEDVLRLAAHGYVKPGISAWDQWIVRHKLRKHSSLVLEVLGKTNADDLWVLVISPLAEQSFPKLKKMAEDRIDANEHGNSRLDRALISVLASSAHVMPGALALLEGFVKPHPKAVFVAAYSNTNKGGGFHIDLLAPLLSIPSKWPASKERNNLFLAVLTSGTEASSKHLVAAYEAGLMSGEIDSFRLAESDQNPAGQSERVLRGFAHIGVAVSSGNYYRSSDSHLADPSLAARAISVALGQNIAAAWEDVLSMYCHPVVTSGGYNSRRIPPSVTLAVAQRWSKAPQHLKLDLQSQLARRASDVHFPKDLARSIIGTALASKNVVLRKSALDTAVHKYQDLFREEIVASPSFNGHSQLHRTVIQRWPADQVASLEKFLGDSRGKIRYVAAERLLNLQGETAFEKLKPLFSDPDASVRKFMAEASVRFADLDVGPGLLRLLKDSDVGVQAAAAQSMNRIELYFDHVKRWKNWAAGAGLSAESAADALVQQAQKAKTTEIRVLAIQSLATLGKAEVLPILIELLSQDDKAVVQAARAAIEKINAKN
ncbi:MAG: HEAT repeat domain-containing protein [Planctomycetota bacterium]